MGDERTTFTVEKFERKPPASNGRKWCRAQLKPGGWASCFGEDAERELLYKSAAAGATGEQLLLSGVVKVTDEAKGWKNVEDVTLASAAEEAAAPAPGFAGRDKDVSIVRQVAWKVTGPIIAAMIASDTANELDVAVILENADFIAHHIETEILAEEPPQPEQQTGGGPPPDDDIPF
jgi:hypothetical protein